MDKYSRSHVKHRKLCPTYYAPGIYIYIPMLNLYISYKGVSIVKPSCTVTLYYCLSLYISLHINSLSA